MVSRYRGNIFTVQHDPHRSSGETSLESILPLLKLLPALILEQSTYVRLQDKLYVFSANAHRSPRSTCEAQSPNPISKSSRTMLDLLANSA